MMILRKDVVRVEVLAVAALGAFILSRLGNALPLMTKHFCHASPVPETRSNENGAGKNRLRALLRHWTNL